MKKISFFILLSLFILSSCQKEIDTAESNILKDIEQSQEYKTYVDEVLYEIINLINSSNEENIENIIVSSRINIEAIDRKAQLLSQQLIIKFPQLKKMKEEELVPLFENTIQKRMAIPRGGEDCLNSCWKIYWNDTAWAAAQYMVGLTGGLLSAGTGNAGGFLSSGWLVTTAIRDMRRAETNRNGCVKACP